MKRSHKAETGVLINNEMLNTILNLSPLAIIALDKSGNVVLWNKTAERIFGWTAEEIIGKPYPIVPPTLHHEFLDIQNRLMSGEDIPLHRLVRQRKDGSWIDVNLSVTHIRDSSGNITYAVAFFGALQESEGIEKYPLESERILTTLLSNLSGMAYRCLNDPSWTTEFVSNGCYTLTGYKPEDFVGNRVISYSQIIHPDDRENVWNDVQKAVRERAPFTLTYRVITASKEIKWVWEQGRAVYGTDGSLEALEGYVVDVTERTLLMNAIQTVLKNTTAVGTDFFRSLVIQLSEALNVKYAFVGELISTNPSRILTIALCENGKISKNITYDLDCSPCETVVGKSFCFYPNHIQELFPKDDLLKEMGAESYMGAPLFSGEGEPLGLVAVIDTKPMKESDIGKYLLTIFAARAGAELESLRAESSLRASEQRFRSVWEDSAEGMRIIDTNTKIVDVNNAYCKLVGMSREELIGQYYGIVYDDSPEKAKLDIEELKQRIIERNVPQITNVTLNTKRSGTIITDVISTFITTPGGEPLLLSVFHDVTERIHAEEALRQAQKMESLGILAGGIAHDFNNLLQAMLGQTFLALKKMPAESSARENIEKAQKAAQRAADLTQQLLAYSGRGTFNIRTLEVNTLIRENIHLLEVTVPKNVELIPSLAAEQLHIKADVAKLQQVIMNLVINAAEAMEGRMGRVTIATQRRTITDKETYLWSRQNTSFVAGDYSVVEVIDNGQGMSYETMERIFDPFYTTKFKGRGLGLAAVLGIVRGHNGGMQVESEPGKGTAFRIAFPLVSQKVSEEEIETVNQPYTKMGGTLLIVDDEALVREVFFDTFTHHGFDVLTAPTGEEGIEMYLKNKSKINLIVLDLSMPGMGGEETFKKLKSINPNVKVILSSGYAEEEATKKFEGTGLTGFIHKPYQWNTLVKTIHQFLK